MMTTNKPGWKNFRHLSIMQVCKNANKIERKSGETKQGFGLGRCRSKGRHGVAVKIFLIAMMLNLKQIVKLRTGVNLDARAYPHD